MHADRGNSDDRPLTRVHVAAVHGGGRAGHGGDGFPSSTSAASAAAERHEPSGSYGSIDRKPRAPRERRARRTNSNSSRRSRPKVSSSSAAVHVTTTSRSSEMSMSARRTSRGGRAVLTRTWRNPRSSSSNVPTVRLPVPGAPVRRIRRGVSARVSLVIGTTSLHETHRSGRRPLPSRGRRACPRTSRSARRGSSRRRGRRA